MLQELPCVFPESGEFEYSDVPTKGCKDPFMSTVRHGPKPCGERCCRPDHEGDFINIGPVRGRKTDR